jgi:DNA-3-methyladenine glycosylase
MIEVEAYLRDDAACHAARGETPRTKPMWGDPGFSYVYLIYGCYYCFNAVCLPKGSAEAVLVRAIEPQFELPYLEKNRPTTRHHDLTNGPGKLCVALDIKRNLDALDICDLNSPIIIAENPEVTRFRREKGPMITTTRIGITKAADLPLRFYLDGSEFVSKRVSKRPRK